MRPPDYGMGRHPRVVRVDHFPGGPRAGGSSGGNRGLCLPTNWPVLL